MLVFLGVLSYVSKAQFSEVKWGERDSESRWASPKRMARRKGKVHVHGELWNAESDEPIAAGDKVIVTEVKGMIVKVKKERG